jgi:type II secretory pathway component GspD/PulD (secretin)
MKTQPQFRSAWLAGLVLLGVASGLYAAQGAGAPGGKKGGGKKSYYGAAGGSAGGKAPAPQLHIKAFRLRHTAPQVVAGIAQQLFAAPAGPFGGAAGFSPIGGLGPSGSMTMAGAGFGGALRMVADAGSHTLLVRGSKRDLDVVGELVSLLDQRGGKATTKTANLGVFDLRHASPEAVVKAVSQLGIQARIAVVPDTRKLIVRGSEEELGEVRQVVQALDVVQDKGGAEEGK